LKLIYFDYFFVYRDDILKIDEQNAAATQVKPGTSGHGRGALSTPGKTPTTAASVPLSSIHKSSHQIQKEASFVYIGRARAHTGAITGISFGVKDGNETLVSISEDQ
jgi:hypothetical protein